MPIYLNSSAVICARAEEPGLPEEQKAKLLAITEELRENALAVLTAECIQPFTRSFLFLLTKGKPRHRLFSISEGREIPCMETTR